MTADSRQLSLEREKKRLYFLIEIVFVKILTALYARVCRDCVTNIDKISFFANLGAKLFQEAAGLSRWQELTINSRKKEKKKKKKNGEVNNAAKNLAKSFKAETLYLQSLA